MYTKLTRNVWFVRNVNSYINYNIKNDSPVAHPNSRFSFDRGFI